MPEKDTGPEQDVEEEAGDAVSSDEAEEAPEAPETPEAPDGADGSDEKGAEQPDEEESVEEPDPAAATDTDDEPQTDDERADDATPAEDPAADLPEDEADDEPEDEAADGPEDTVTEEQEPETEAAEDAAVPADDQPSDDEQQSESDPTGEAEKAKAEEPPVDGRRRLVDALVHVRRGQAVVAALLCILGFAAVLQVRTNDQDTSFNGQREQDLIDILSGLAGTTQKAQDQLESLQRSRSELEHQTSKQQAALERSQQQADTLRVVAGTTPVEGPGVVITIEPGSDDLHLTPVLDLIEELRSNGAEAIDVNGKVRLVASSAVEVSTSVSGLIIEGQLVRPPYKLHVIGPQDTLKGAIEFFRGPEDQLKNDGAKVRVTKSENVKIETVHTPPR